MSYYEYVQEWFHPLLLAIWKTNLMIFGRDDKLKCADIALSEFESMFPLDLPFVVDVTSGHIDEKS